VNGISDREVEVRVLILREELLSRPLMKAVDAIRELVSIDLTGAPSSELSLKVRELSGELTFVSHAAELTEFTTLPFVNSRLVFITSFPKPPNVSGEPREF
jgi:hypothetical protein